MHEQRHQILLVDDGPIQKLLDRPWTMIQPLISVS